MVVEEIEYETLQLFNELNILFKTQTKKFIIISILTQSTTIYVRLYLQSGPSSDIRITTSVLT